MTGVPSKTTAWRASSGFRVPAVRASTLAAGRLMHMTRHLRPAFHQAGVGAVVAT